MHASLMHKLITFGCVRLQLLSSLVQVLAKIWTKIQVYAYVHNKTIMAHIITINLIVNCKEFVMLLLACINLYINNNVCGCPCNPFLDQLYELEQEVK